jgi:hypothetical protein
MLVGVSTTSLTGQQVPQQLSDFRELLDDRR